MYVCRSTGNIGSPQSQLSRLFEVIGTDTDRLGTYDFLLMFLSNPGPVFTILMTQQLAEKLQIFPTTAYLMPPLSEFLLEFCNAG